MAHFHGVVQVSTVRFGTERPDPDSRHGVCRKVAIDDKAQQ